MDVVGFKLYAKVLLEVGTDTADGVVDVTGFITSVEVDCSHLAATTVISRLVFNGVEELHLKHL